MKKPPHSQLQLGSAKMTLVITLLQTCKKLPNWKDCQLRTFQIFKPNFTVDLIPITPDDEEEVDDVTEIHSSPVKHSQAQRDQSRTSGSSVTNNQDVTSAFKRRIDDGVVTIISSSDDEEDEGEIFSSPVKHTNAPGRQSPRKCFKSRERPEGRTAIKQRKKRSTQYRSQHSMDNHQIEEQQDTNSNRGKSPADEMMKSKKPKGDRGSSSRIPSNYVKGKTKSDCSKVSSKQNSSKENERLDYENVTNDINYLKQEYKNQGNNFTIYPLVHCNIMPLSEALHRVNAPVKKTKPKVLFGVGGLINSRNMNWHTVIDEG
ncbi:uncharacterized protein [Apostichopus japonicus]|uniref:uncharacterized protein isoform X2 n=1 Tax=Stichopus japonicus TaxID=307972 RepID=UPI003AB6A4C6